MKNKGRKHKSGNGPYANGNCKGALCGITRDITKMGSPSKKKIRMGSAFQGWTVVRIHYKVQTLSLDNKDRGVDCKVEWL